MNTAVMQGRDAPAYAPSRRRKSARMFSMTQVYAGAYRQRWVMLGIFLLALLIGALITFLTPRSYSAQASIQLEQQAPRVLPNDDLDPVVNVNDAERFLQTQLDRIISRATADGVERRLRISANPAMLAALGFEEGGVNASREAIISTLQQHVTAELGLNTRLARITYTSRDPAVSAAVANAYADVMASSNIIAKGETAARAEQYLGTELADARAKLQESERAMLAYARQADLTTTIVPGSGVNNDRGGSLRAQQLGTLTDSLADATARRIQAQQRWQQIQGTNAMALPEVQQNGAIQSLISERAELDAQMAEERERYTGEFPGVSATAAKAREIDGQIGELAANIKRSYQQQYQAAAAAERQLRGVVSEMQGAALSERERSVTYNALQRDLDTNRAFYDGLLQRYREVAAASGAPGENITVVDRAVAPSLPTSPDVGRNMALAGILGLIGAIGIGLLRERSGTVIRSSEDAERDLGLESLGVVPVLRRNTRADDALMDPRSPQSEAYYSVAVALYRLAGNVLPKSVLLTSSAPGEGKSTSSIGLARSYAAMGRKVLLVDGDLRRPSLGSMLGPLLGPGLANVLAGSTTDAEAIHRLQNHGFDVMTAGDVQGDPVSLLSTDAVDQVLARLTGQYDTVIIDGPPVLGIADAVLLAGKVAVGVFVVEANRKDAEALQVAVGRLPAELPMGVVITKFDARTAGVKYGDHNYYKY